jgi:hypothetical protein
VLAAQEHAGEVCCYRPVPDVEGHLCYRDRRVEPGGRVDEDFEATELGDCALDGGFHLGLARDVAFEGERFHALVTSLQRDPFDAGEVDVQQRDVCAFGGERKRRRPADALGGAGDDGVLALKSHFPPLPLATSGAMDRVESVARTGLRAIDQTPESLSYVAREGRG